MPVLDAEFTKLSVSGMLATRISYINDLAVVAEKLGIDIEHVRQGLAADSRIGLHIFIQVLALAVKTSLMMF